MTIATAFNSWQDGDQPGPPWTGSPNARAIQNFMLAAMAGTNLGVNVNVRPVRQGESWSDHAFGAAGDWGYGNAHDKATFGGNDYGGPGRDYVLATLIPWMIDNSAELGIQRIHDYVGDRIWQAGRTNNIADAHTGWWKKQNGAGSGMGEAWAAYLHTATHPMTYFNGVPVLERTGITALGGTTPPAVDWAELARIDAEMRATVYPGTPVVKGSTGRPVEAVQWRIHALGDPVAVDGQFGPKTEEAVKRFQVANALFVDGIVGPTTWTRLGLAMAPPPIPEPPVPPPTTPGAQYVVQPGDGWWRIAERTLWDGAAYKQIAAANGGEGRVLHAGDKVFVSGARATTVVPGDGWISVSNRLGRDYKEVQAKNAWQGSMLHPGMLIWGGKA